MRNIIAEIFTERQRYSVDGKVVLVTGALTAVGRGLAQRLVQLGACVVLADHVSDGTGETFSESINATAGRQASVYVSAQPGQLDSLRLMVDAAVLAFGQLDVLVNNTEQYAGGQGQEEGHEDDAAHVCAAIDAGFRAPVAATLVFARYLRQTDNTGVAVNVAAMAGLLPGRGREVFGAANAGLIHFTEASRAMAPRLRVCALAPYYIDTAEPPLLSQRRMLPGQRLGAPLLALSADQVVASVVRCIEDTRMAGRTLLIAGESSYVNSWSYFISCLHVLAIMAWSMLALLFQRALLALTRSHAQQSLPEMPIGSDGSGCDAGCDSGCDSDPDPDQRKLRTE
ncbi:hypothetical protein EV175_004347 [Coemansia sp. RSA 1933]|nr:hypothetical protein EV175_004347 [Coemansia sp. RSA 1933]